MQGYATAEQISLTRELRAVPSNPPLPSDDNLGALGGSFIDELVGRLADLIADRVAAKLAADEQTKEGWLDTRGAAAYLGVHRDTIRRLAAESVLPAQQAGTGCKLYFRRRDLDEWRSSNGPSLRSIAAVSRSWSR